MIIWSKHSELRVMETFQKLKPHTEIPGKENLTLTIGFRRTHRTGTTQERV